MPRSISRDVLTHASRGNTEPSPPRSSSSSTPSISLQPFEVLAESDLAVLPDFAYLADPGQDDAIRTQGTKESINLAFSGAIALNAAPAAAAASCKPRVSPVSSTSRCTAWAK